MGAIRIILILLGSIMIGCSGGGAGSNSVSGGDGSGTDNSDSANNGGSSEGDQLISEKSGFFQILLDTDVIALDDLHIAQRLPSGKYAVGGSATVDSNKVTLVYLLDSNFNLVQDFGSAGSVTVSDYGDTNPKVEQFLETDSGLLILLTSQLASGGNLSTPYPVVTMYNDNGQLNTDFGDQGVVEMQFSDFSGGRYEFPPSVIKSENSGFYVSYSGNSYVDSPSNFRSRTVKLDSSGQRDLTFGSSGIYAYDTHNRFSGDHVKLKFSADGTHLVSLSREGYCRTCSSPTATYSFVERITFAGVRLSGSSVQWITQSIHNLPIDFTETDDGDIMVLSRRIYRTTDYDQYYVFKVSEGDNSVTDIFYTSSAALFQDYPRAITFNEATGKLEVLSTYSDYILTKKQDHIIIGLTEIDPSTAASDKTVHYDDYSPTSFVKYGEINSFDGGFGTLHKEKEGYIISIFKD